ncbi:hypothetical protein TNCV_3879561 [Trichonephila clavipes]|nr:hypothetical protein TNCV_3879561 [Trichonephila clavipes]
MKSGSLSLANSIFNASCIAFPLPQRSRTKRFPLAKRLRDVTADNGSSNFIPPCPARRLKTQISLFIPGYSHEEKAHWLCAGASVKEYVPSPDEARLPRLPDSIDQPITAMPQSRMHNSTFATPNITAIQIRD